MTEEELKQKCKERAKIFQQAMESCHSSSPIDCIEWFADRIAELEKENAELKKRVDNLYNSDCWASEQLTKAKEIIREFVEWATWQGNSKCPSFKSIQDKAEQFLNSEVEK